MNRSFIQGNQTRPAKTSRPCFVLALRCGSLRSPPLRPRTKQSRIASELIYRKKFTRTKIRLVSSF